MLDPETQGHQVTEWVGGANRVRDREERQLPIKRKTTQRREWMIKEEKPAESTKKSKNRPSYIFSMIS